MLINNLSVKKFRTYMRPHICGASSRSKLFANAINSSKSTASGQSVRTCNFISSHGQYASYLPTSPWFSLSSSKHVIWCTGTSSPPRLSPLVCWTRPSRELAPPRRAQCHQRAPPPPLPPPASHKPKVTSPSCNQIRKPNMYR